MTSVTPDALCKTYTDLWMHQNRLVWDRVQHLALLQIGFLGIAWALRNPELHGTYFISHRGFFIQTVCVIAAVATVFLWNISYRDSRRRNNYSDRLKEFGVVLNLPGRWR